MMIKGVRGGQVISDWRFNCKFFNYFMERLEGQNEQTGHHTGPEQDVMPTLMAIFTTLPICYFAVLEFCEFLVSILGWPVTEN